jgi:aminopeptidase N
MMMQLELLMGKEIFKKGIRQYLETFKMNNADWEELVAILDPLTLKDLESWSNAWVDKSGMPVIISINNLNREGDYSGYRLIQSKKESNSSIMGMKIGLSRFFPDKKEEYNIEMTGDTTEVPIPSGPASNNWILPNSDGKGYGLFYPDSLSLYSLLNSTTLINNNLSRSSWYVMANELFLHGMIDPEKYYTLLVSNILAETESQTRQYLLNVLEIVWWNFFSPEQRNINSIHLERSLFQLLTSKNIKENELKPIFWTFTRIALTEDAKMKIYKVWNNEKELPGVKLDESDYMVLAYELAVRNFNNSDSILKVQENRIINTDRLAKFMFIKKAVLIGKAKLVPFELLRCK